MDSGTERRTVRVTIFNQAYNLLASEDPGEVEALARSVDELMTEVAQRAGNIDSNRVAVLACLHMADRLKSIERELSELKARVDQKSHHLSLLLEEAARGE